MSSKTEGVSEISVTIKASKDFAASWTVYRGSVDQIREAIVSYYGIDPGYSEGVTLHELVVAANHIAQGTGSVAAVLGGTPISVTESLTGEPTGDAAWAEAEKDKAPYGGSPAADVTPVDPNAELIGQLQSATSVESLKKLWVDNQAAFSDKDVKAAYSKRGKALKAAEKAAA